MEWMEKSNVRININGEIFPPDQARISVFDRGFLFGDSIYEVVRTYQGKLSLWEEHYRRLCLSGEKIGLTVPYSSSFLRERINETINAIEGSADTNYFVRLIITRGVGGFTMSFNDLSACNLVIMAKVLSPYPKDWYQRGVRVIMATTQRTTADSVDPSIKSGNYLNNVMAYQEASIQNAYDAIMLNPEGQITEATTSNFWIVKDGVLLTPPLKAGILEGITRQVILKICQQIGQRVEERALYPDDLFNAEECFLSSSTKELIPVVQVDDKLIAAGLPGAITSKIHQAYLNFVETHL